MRQSGYLMQSKDTYLANNVALGILDEVFVQTFQQYAGLEVTGSVDVLTWNAAFATGQNAGSITAVPASMRRLMASCPSIPLTSSVTTG